MQRGPRGRRGPATRPADVLAILSEIAERCAREPRYLDWTLSRIGQVIDLTAEAEVREAMVRYRRAVEEYCAAV